MKVAVWQSATVLGMAQWLNLSSYRPLVLPTGLIQAALANYDMPNVAILIHFTTSVIRLVRPKFDIRSHPCSRWG